MTTAILSTILDHCHGCDSHHILPDGTEAYVCPKLMAMAFKDPRTDGWIMFAGPPVLPLVQSLSSAIALFRGLVS